jgi:hypothetical protein
MLGPGVLVKGVRKRTKSPPDLYFSRGHISLD